MHGNRIERVQEEVRREISAILQQRASDPRLTWLSVSRVEISKDLTHAKVFVSSLGDAETRAGALKALQKAGPFIRAELSRRIQLRHTPELSFREDRGLEASLRVSQILAESTRTHPETSSDASDEEVEGDAGSHRDHDAGHGHDFDHGRDDCDDDADDDGDHDFEVDDEDDDDGDTGVNPDAPRSRFSRRDGDVSP